MNQFLQAWQRAFGKKTERNPHRWIVLDVETTGLDLRNDQLLSVAAMAVHITQRGLELSFADSFEVTLHQSEQTSTPENVLLHRIGWGHQSVGVPATQAMTQLLMWVGNSPVVAFHAWFDQAFIKKVVAQSLGVQLDWLWLDLAQLLPAAFDEVKAQTLDGWMHALRVPCVQRHQAAADVWATAQLLLMASNRLESTGPLDWETYSLLIEKKQWLKRLQSHGM